MFSLWIYMVLYIQGSQIATFRLIQSEDYIGMTQDIHFLDYEKIFPFFRKRKQIQLNSQEPTQLIWIQNQYYKGKKISF